MTILISGLAPGLVTASERNSAGHAPFADVSRPRANADEAAACKAWFVQADSALRRANIHDAASVPLPDAPWLHSSRWLNGLFGLTHHDPALREAWLTLAADTGFTSWQARLARLAPDHHWAPTLWHCQQALLDQQLTAGNDIGALTLPEIPDSYNTWQRALGLYPLTRRLAAPAVNRYHRTMSARLASNDVQAARFFLAPHAPQGDGAMTAPEHVANLPPLALPDDATRNVLLQHYAPVIATERDKHDNHPGAIAIDDAGIRVLTNDPVSYTWLTWTRFNNTPLLQLNYQFWFPRRPATGRFDMYAGELDSVIWRVTLRPDGKVLFYDSIHACGCYHKLFISTASADRIAHRVPDGDRPVTAPAPVPDAATQRLQLLLESGTHYLVGVTAATPIHHTDTVPDMLPATRYRLHAADKLRQLPAPDGGITSLFNSNGLIPASRRPERFTLWPMGIPSAGAMRQQGTQATAFIGRRHFDDGDLAETLFTSLE
ncbi:hypothetical protein K8B33_11735 [Alcanivorax sp. JB21]|uniref:hypothetical protein n=1 Tax=Alcanivorax limicola TaxID=2874102 RepID=UPI001CC1BA59|nr:hypothetical protein [Alcanivorax limicola]MBZ2189772.1 hypothetical protein [Alcanivorax limicola]